MQPTNNHPFNNDIDEIALGVETLESELQEVQTSLIAATGDLPTPLGDLVRAQIRRSHPPLCGAVVMVVSKPLSGAHEDSDFHHKRILLASALEMLHIALNVHRVLVYAARTEQIEQKVGSEAELDRAFIGSIILAGDYCFSRAAQMAAQTDNPRVVATFSLALQGVSEGLLREQFAPHSEQSYYDEMAQLLQSGALAAAQLANLSEKQEQHALTYSQEFARFQKDIAPSDSNLPLPDIESLPSNWQTLHNWLVHQYSSGALSQSIYQPYS